MNGTSPFIVKTFCNAMQSSVAVGRGIVTFNGAPCCFNGMSMWSSIGKAKRSILACTDWAFLGAIKVEQLPVMSQGQTYTKERLHCKSDDEMSREDFEDLHKKTIDDMFKVGILKFVQIQSNAIIDVETTNLDEQLAPAPIQAPTPTTNEQN